MIDTNLVTTRDYVKTWVFIRQIILGISGTGIIASWIPPETLVKILDTVTEVVPHAIFIGTAIYGLFFGKPAKAADEIKKAP